MKDFDKIELTDTAELERQVLADAVASPEALGDVLPLVHGEFFTKTSRRNIWELIVDRYNKGQDVNILSIGQLTGKDFSLEIAGSLSNAGGVMNCIEHAYLLRAGAAKRRAYFAVSQFLSDSLSPLATEADVLANLEAFNRNVEGPAPLQEESLLADVFQDVRNAAKQEEKAAKEGKTTRIATGFDNLDKFINKGFKPGQLVILAARPGVGKTSIMLHIAKNAAKAGNPVYISTLEMTDQELGEKFVFSTGRVRPYDINNGQINWQEFDKAGEELKGLPIYINQFSRTLDEIIGRLTQAVKQGRCKIAFIDYLGLIQDTNNLGGGAKLYQIIAKITGTLKGVAKRLGIPIVLLCQLNREQAREKRAPELYDLRDSGSIEQDADIVLMLEAKPEERHIVAWLRKNRGGRKTTQSGRDLGFVFVPNDTYSAFTEEAPIGDEPEDLPETAAPVFHNEPQEKDDLFDDNLPF